MTLWDRDRPEYSDEHMEDLNAQISYDVQDFLDRAYFANAAELKADAMEGCEETLNVSKETEMIPAILQLAEAIVVNQDSYVLTEEIREVRHKIVDRIASLHLLE